MASDGRKQPRFSQSGWTEKRLNHFRYMIHTNVALASAEAHYVPNKEAKGEFIAAMCHLSDLELKRKLGADVQISINFTKRLLWETM